MNKISDSKLWSSGEDCYNSGDAVEQLNQVRASKEIEESKLDTHWQLRFSEIVLYDPFANPSRRSLCASGLTQHGFLLKPSYRTTYCSKRFLRQHFRYRDLILPRIPAEYRLVPAVKATYEYDISDTFMCCFENDVDCQKESFGECVVKV